MVTELVSLPAMRYSVTAHCSMGFYQSIFVHLEDFPRRGCLGLCFRSKSLNHKIIYLDDHALNARKAASKGFLPY